MLDLAQACKTGVLEYWNIGVVVSIHLLIARQLQ